MFDWCVWSNFSSIMLRNLSHCSEFAIKCLQQGCGVLVCTPIPKCTTSTLQMYTLIIYFSDHKPAVDKQNNVPKSTTKETALQEDRNPIFSEWFKGVYKGKNRSEVCTITQSLMSEVYKLLVIWQHQHFFTCNLVKIIFINIFFSFLQVSRRFQFRPFDRSTGSLGSLVASERNRSCLHQSIQVSSTSVASSYPELEISEILHVIFLTSCYRCIQFFEFGCSASSIQYHLVM